MVLGAVQVQSDHVIRILLNKKAELQELSSDVLIIQEYNVLKFGVITIHITPRGQVRKCLT